jgi:hypothetical protein
MIQPSPKSSSSEETLSDSSIDSTELIAELDKLEKEKPVHKPTKRITKKPILIVSDEESPTIIDTSILDQPTNTTTIKSPTILDHLSTHLSGDAFTHSNTASPDHFHFVNTTSNLPSDPPLPEPQIQSPPSSLADIEQEDPPTFTPAQDEVITHSDHITKPPTPQPELSTPEPTPEPQTPSSEPIYGPVYKPLTIEELCLPIDFALPILEDLLKAEINVDDDIITIDPFDKIKRIKIIPLKRKKA